MVTVDVEGDDVVVRVRGLDRLWALASSVRIARPNLRTARVVSRPEAVRRAGGWRLGGTAVPGLVIAGRYRSRGVWSFWVAHRAQQLLLIETDRVKYRYLVLELDEPHRVAAALSAVAGH